MSLTLPVAPARPSIRHSALLLGAVVLLHAGSAAPCPPRPPRARPSEPNGIETTLGTTNSNAAVGQGRLTATLSRCGEITSLKWPGPSFYDQLSYLTSNAPDARALAHDGAFDSMGAFAGVVVREGGATTVSWLRDPGWTGEQSYTTSTSAVVRNAFRNDALGLEVVQTAFVLPGRDVLALRYRVTRRPGGPHDASLVFYQNLAPSLARIPFFPLADTALEHQNDHALLWDGEARALLHYRPASGRWGGLDAILQDPPADPAALAEAVQAFSSSLVEEGVYLALGARGPVAAFQAGYDDAPLCAYQNALAERAIGNLGLPPSLTPLIRLLFVCDPDALPGGSLVARCRAQRGWTHEAASAWVDAADGALSNSPVAACQANGALLSALDFHGAHAEATLYLAAGPTRADALAGLAAARDPATPPAAQQANAEAWWAEQLAPAILPETHDPRVLRFARRALVSLITASDAASGAIVASVATQPPYGLDWPRDGAFLNRALDEAGYTERVSEHERFYARVQRTAFSPWSIAYPFACPANPAARSYPDCVPPGTWEMNYYAVPDAVVAGGPISFEIDTTGLALWALWDHASFLAGPERADYLDDVCPALGRGVDALADCRDPATGLPCPAAEDDNLELTQGLQGAETVLLAVKAGLEAAGDCGFDAARVAGWADRADELDAAILEHFRVDDHFEGARSAWMLWPVRFRPYDDLLMAGHAEFIHEHSVVPLLDRSAPGAGYNAENVLARAVRFRALGDAAGLATVQSDVVALIHLLTTADTGHMAEFAGRVDADLDGDGVAPDYLPENDVPHVWQQSYLYLAAMEAFGPRSGPAPRACDATGDGEIDRRDVQAILTSRAEPPVDLLDPRDPDEDGAVTVSDARLCVARCDRAECGVAPAAGCGLSGMEAAAVVWLLRRRRRRGTAGRRTARTRIG